MKRCFMKTFGAALACAVLFSFSVCAAAGTVPALSSSSVKDGSTDIDINVGKIVLAFEDNVVNSAVRSNNAGCFRLVKGDGTEVAVTVEMADDQTSPNLSRNITVEFGTLEAGTAYKLVISGDLTSESGGKLGQAETISFTTADAAKANTPGTETATSAAPTETGTAAATQTPESTTPAETGTAAGQTATSTATVAESQTGTATAPDTSAKTGTSTASADKSSKSAKTSASDKSAASTKTAASNELPEASPETTAIVMIISAIASTAVVALFLVYRSREAKKKNGKK